MRWVLLGAVIAAALGNWWSRYRDDERLEQITKPLTTVLVIGVALASGAPTTQIATAVVALTLCLVGDVALLPVIDRFVVGLAAFLLGHLGFLVLFAQYSFDRWPLGVVATALCLALVATVGRTIVSGARSRDAALHLPVVSYLVIISVMAVGGWSTGRWWAIAGSTMFVVSDSLLGWRQFVRSRPFMQVAVPFMQVAVMVTYHAALVMLTLSLW